MIKGFEYQNLGRQLRNTESKTPLWAPSKLNNIIGNQSMYEVMQFAQWTPTEDTLLIQLFLQFGENHWSQISAQIPGRTSHDCRNRWVDYLSSNCPAEWTAEEDQLLLDKYNQLGSNWDNLVLFFSWENNNSGKIPVYSITEKN